MQSNSSADAEQSDVVEMEERRARTATDCDDSARSRCAPVMEPVRRERDSAPLTDTDARTLHECERNDAHSTREESAQDPQDPQRETPHTYFAAPDGLYPFHYILTYSLHYSNFHKSIIANEGIISRKNLNLNISKSFICLQFKYLGIFVSLFSPNQSTNNFQFFRQSLILQDQSCLNW